MKKVLLAAAAAATLTLTGIGPAMASTTHATPSAAPDQSLIASYCTGGADLCLSDNADLSTPGNPVYMRAFSQGLASQQIEIVDGGTELKFTSAGSNVCLGATEARNVIITTCSNSSAQWLPTSTSNGTILENSFLQSYFHNPAEREVLTGSSDIGKQALVREYNNDGVQVWGQTFR
jgi:hypothetical protein